MQVRHVVPPESASTRPSDSVVAVGYQRRDAIDGAADQLSVTGSKKFASAAPRIPFALSCPPITRRRPSASCDAPAQKRFVLPIGRSTIPPVTGFHTRSGQVFVKSPENINTEPVCMRTALTATRPSSNGASHRPTMEGSFGFTTVTDTAEDVALLPAASRAVAES